VRRAFLLTGLAAIATCVALLAWPRDGDTRDRASRASAAAQLRWTEGDVAAYDFSVDVVARIGSPDMPTSTVRQRHSGVLHLRILEVGESVLAAFQVEPMHIRVSGNTEEKKIGPIAGLPCWVRFERTGEIREIVFHEQATAGTRDILEETIRTFQCVMPARAGVFWRTRESHSTGEFTADYSLTGPSQLRKTKRRYASEQIIIEESKGAFVLAESSWLAQASLDERTRIETEEGVRIQGTTVARLALLEIERHRNAPAPERKRKSDAAVTREDVERTLLALNASDGGSGILTRKLGRQLASDPKHIEVLMKHLGSDRTTEGSAAAMIGALGIAGSEQTQEALSGILLGDQWSHAHRRRAAIALAFLLEPNESAMNSLWTAADRRGDPVATDLSNTALLALGSTTGTLGQRGSREHERHRSRLVSRLQRVTDQEERIVVLKALGNTRDATLLSDVAAHLEDPDYAVRAASAYALRSMKDPGTAERLAARLGLEPDIGVRQVLASSLNRLDATTPRVLEIALAHAQTEKDESTRYALVDLLARHMSEVPGCRAAFLRMLRAETSSRTRKQLGTALLAESQTRRRN
jgi:HEAT repeat protein